MIHILGLVSSSNTIDCWIKAGQSGQRGNTGGVAPVSPYNTPNANAFIIGKDGATVEFSNFSVMDYSTGNLLGFEHGSEVSIAYSYNNNPVYMVKVVKGATNLAVDWASGSTLRNDLIAKIITARDYFVANNIKVRWIWSWNQWESDTPTTQYSNDYEVNYRGLINEVINSTGINIGKHLIIGVSTTSNFYLNNTTNAQTIQQAQINNAAFYGATIINQSDLDKHDGVHLTSSSYITLGEREYQAIYPL